MVGWIQLVRRKDLVVFSRLCLDHTHNLNCLFGGVSLDKLFTGLGSSLHKSSPQIPKGMALSLPNYAQLHVQYNTNTSGVFNCVDGVLVNVVTLYLVF